MNLNTSPTTVKRPNWNVRLAGARQPRDRFRHQNLAQIDLAFSDGDAVAYNGGTGLKHNCMLRKTLLSVFCAAILMATFGAAIRAQQPAPAGSRYDITNYRMEVQLQPDDHTLRAGADVTFTPLEATRSLVFELNGSLKVNSVEKDGHVLTGVVQDPVGSGAFGPNVRIDLGQVVPANTPITLRIRWSGALISPEGGPLASKRLAYVGTEGSYLMYAARWFPFHDYAADRATADITVIVPTGVQVGGLSDEPVSPQVDKTGTTRFRFVTSVGSLRMTLVRSTTGRWSACIPSEDRR